MSGTSSFSWLESFREPLTGHPFASLVLRSSFISIFYYFLLLSSLVCVYKHKFWRVCSKSKVKVIHILHNRVLTWILLFCSMKTKLCMLVFNIANNVWNLLLLGKLLRMHLLVELVQLSSKTNRNITSFFLLFCPLVKSVVISTNCFFEAFVLVVSAFNIF